VYLAFSDDATSYDAPSWIQSSDTSNKDSDSPFETIVDVSGSDNGIVGQSFYVYYGYRFKVSGVAESDYPRLWRWLYRQKVTLNRAGFDKKTYNASTDFTSKQGENNWYNFTYDGSRYSEMVWDDSEFRWKGPDRFLLVASTGQHPDGGKDSVRAWLAPKNGIVHISAANISVANGPDADGVGVKIVKNDVPIWPSTGYQRVSPGAGVVFGGADIAVAKNDTIYFHVNQNVGTAYDSTHWARPFQDRRSCWQGLASRVDGHGVRAVAGEPFGVVCRVRNVVKLR
jgi:hypothetical protein